MAEFTGAKHEFSRGTGRSPEEWTTPRPLPTRARKTMAATDDLEDLEFVNARKAMYDEIVEPFPTSYGKNLSKKERDETDQHQSTLVYGEINFESFAVAFEKIKLNYGRPNEGACGPDGIMQKPGGKFYDIGSGTGKPAIAAALLHSFDFVGGVEILEGLHKASLEIAQAWREKGNSLLEAAGAGPAAQMEFVQGDATDLRVCDWSDGDVLFANSTCFDDDLMHQVADAAASLKQGSIFITFTKRLPSDHFRVLENKLYQMSWGGATVFIQQKITGPWGVPGLEDEEDLEEVQAQAAAAAEAAAGAAEAGDPGNGQITLVPEQTYRLRSGQELVLSVAAASGGGTFGCRATGQIIWDAAFALARVMESIPPTYLGGASPVVDPLFADPNASTGSVEEATATASAVGDNTAPPSVFQGKRVLEIGAGCGGIPGQVAALLGASAVTFTDVASELSGLETNVDTNVRGIGDKAPLNPCVCKLEVAELDWTDSSAAARFADYDIVLAADVLYEETYTAVAEFLAQLFRVNPGIHVLMGNTSRRAVHIFQRLSKGLNLHLQKLHSPSWGLNAMSDIIWVITMERNT